MLIIIRYKSITKLKCSNGKNLNWMFLGCSSLSDIKALQNWNVSNENYYIGMLRGCPLLSDIKVLENWNLSNWKNNSMII